MRGDKPAIVINLFVYYAQAGRIIVAWRDCKCRRGEHCRAAIYPQDICLSGPRWPSTAADGLNILSIAAAAAPACVSEVKGRTDGERKSAAFRIKKGVNTHTAARTQRLLFIRGVASWSWGKKITRSHEEPQAVRKNDLWTPQVRWEKKHTSEIFIAMPSRQKRRCVFVPRSCTPIYFFVFPLRNAAVTPVRPKQQSDGYDIC